MTSLANLQVQRPSGESVTIGGLVDRPTILVIPRYYGCLPCRDYLRTVSDRYDEITDAGAAALGLSVGADFQAEWLQQEYGIPFELLVDPERNVLDALALQRKLSIVLNPKGYATYAKAIFRGNRQGKIVSPLQAPGLALLDADANAVWVHRGKALGDYPTLDEVLERLAGISLAPAASATPST